MGENGSSKGWKSRDPEEVLGFMEPGEPYSTSEIADGLGWPHRSTLHVLDSLADAGEIRKKKPSAKQAIWMLSEGE